MAGRIRRWRDWSQATAWRVAFGVAITLCLAAFAANLATSELRPGNAWGLGYGIAAATLLVAAVLIGVRRRTVSFAARRRLGSASSWLYLHVYGGILFLLLLLMHTRLHLPNGALAWWMWGLSLWTAASGLVGLGLQQWIPKALTSGLSIEVIYERIPELIDEIRQRAEALAATCDEPTQALYTRIIGPALAAPTWHWIYFVDITGGIRSRLKEVHYLGGFLPAAEKEKLDLLERDCRTKLEIDAHYTLQRALRWWLWLHVPASLVLLVFVVVHMFTVLYY
jgi:hypothetical protein